MEGQGVIPLAPEDETIVIINEALNSIANRDKQEFGVWLQYIPLENLDRDDTNYLLNRFLVQIVQYNYPEALDVIFDAWQKVYPLEEQGKLSFNTLLFTIDLIEPETLAYVVLNVDNMTFLNTIDELIPPADIHQVGMVCQKAFDAFYTWKELTEDDYKMFKTLQTEAYTQQNTDVYNFLTDKLREISPYAEIPSWAKDFRDKIEGIPVTADTDVNSLPTEVELDIKLETPDVALPPNKELAAMLLEGLKDQVGIEMADKAQEQLVQRLAMAPLAEKLEIIQPIKEIAIGKELEDDIWLYRLYGPPNTQFYPTTEETRVGGARMFSSVLFDNDFDSGITSDWFVGFCLQCNLRIRRRWHAMRIPVPGGGWRGCYCSWKCARGSLLEPDAFDEAINPDVMTPALIDSVEQQIISFGIQDRRDNGDDILDMEDVPPPLMTGNNPSLYLDLGVIGTGLTIRDLYQLQSVPTIPQLLTGVRVQDYVSQGKENVIKDTETSSTIELAGMNPEAMTIHPSALQQ